MQREDRTAFVTGAASGIGEAVARRLAADGCRLMLVDVDRERLQSVRASLAAGRAEAVAAEVVDVADEEAVERAVEATVDRWGGLDVAVNCAGVLGPVGLLHETDTAAYRALIDTNLHGVFHTMKHELRLMQAAGRGSIVNIASAAGLVGFPTAAAYTAAKHGVVGLTRTAAIDYAGTGIRVNAIAPGGVDTPLLRATTGATPEGRAAIEAMHPMSRLGTPAEIANAVAFIASDEASFVTGAVFAVDGGWVAW